MAAVLNLLLDVWREACLHLELQDSVGRIARRVAGYAASDHLLVRRLDMQRGALETVAGAPCRHEAPTISRQRTELTPGGIRDLLIWIRSGEVRQGQLPAVDSVLAAVAPPGFEGACLAAPLPVNQDPAAVVCLLSGRGPFAEADGQLLKRLAEPIGVALANTTRVRELTRLREALEADKQALLSRLQRHDLAEAVVGGDTGLRSVMEKVEQVAAADVPVLIIGETGSGKEVVARALHARSRRASAPIVRVNCGAIPPGLVDSELFGHERGSFTGDIATRQGWFERANGGTLFLDEIGELPLDAQVRLLRILQDGSFERVGGQKPLSVDVRLVAATHRDLRELLARGEFLEDLWYRIGAFPILLPPLRERPEDIPRLAAHFASRAGARLGGTGLVPTPEDIELLLAYEWPGNVRELAAVIERAAILGHGRRLCVADALGSGVRLPGSAVPASAPGSSRAVEGTLDEAMRQHVASALRLSRGRIEGPRGAASQLGINPHTLRARMRRLGISARAYRTSGTDDHPTGDEPLPSYDTAMRTQIERVLKQTNGRIEGPGGAASVLKINAHTLRARMRKLGIPWSEFRVRPQRHAEDAS